MQALFDHDTPARARTPVPLLTRSGRYAALGALVKMSLRHLRAALAETVKL